MTRQMTRRSPCSRESTASCLSVSKVAWRQESFSYEAKFKGSGIVSLPNERRRAIRLLVMCAIVRMGRSRHSQRDRRAVSKRSNTISRPDRSGPLWIKWKKFFWSRRDVIQHFELRDDLLTNMDHLKSLIREVPDFPKPGINFYDITTLLKHPEGLRNTVDALAAQFEGERVDSVIGVEARGFIFAPALAYHLGAGFVPVRKPRKLPAECASISYDLEYGQDTLEIHRDAIGDGHRVLIADDLLATGGTARAVVDLVEQLGGTVVGLVFVVELEFLPGREKLAGYDVRSLIKYQS